MLLGITIPTEEQKIEPVKPDPITEPQVVEPKEEVKPTEEAEE